MNNSEHVSEAAAPQPPPSILRPTTVEPAEPAQPRRKTRSSAVREIVETLILTVIIFFGVRLLVQNYRVEGYSMEPTLRNGQYLLINKIGLHFHQPQRGDIIVFEYPLNPSQNFVKRVIGLPGDSIEVRNHQVILDGKVLKEPYIKAAPNGFYPRTVVPPGDYFVMGDNRNNSSDSRSWGPLPQKDIIGEAWLSYWPPNQWGSVHDYPLAQELGSAAKR
ncbi:MAG: signal peptidase I [Chloroflexota bacterium]